MLNMSEMRVSVGDTETQVWLKTEFEDITDALFQRDQNLQFGFKSFYMLTDLCYVDQLHLLLWKEGTSHAFQQQPSLDDHSEVYQENTVEASSSGPVQSLNEWS